MAAGVSGFGQSAMAGAVRGGDELRQVLDDSSSDAASAAETTITRAKPRMPLLITPSSLSAPLTIAPAVKRESRTVLSPSGTGQWR